MQLDTAERGFSFLREGPLDMRMDPRISTTAADIVNRASQKELTYIFKELGEEPRWKRAVEYILIARKKKRIKTTFDLLEAMGPLMNTKIRGKLHPATLIFQGLRLAVNQELNILRTALEEAIEYLSPLGRIAVISFHRLEDKIVKEVFREKAKEGKLQLITKKPLVPSIQEMKKNPRSRSAKFRVAEKVGSYDA